MLDIPDGFRERFRAAFVFLVAIDLALVGAYVAAGVLAVSGVISGVPPLLSIAGDWGLGEGFNYLKWAAMVVLFARLWARTGQPIHMAFAFVFSVILADDMLRIHEVFGLRLAESFGFPEVAGLRRQDLGELLVWGGLGAAVSAALVLGFWKTPRPERGFGLVMLGVLGLLVMLGVVVDMAGVMILSHLDGSLEKSVAGIVHILEDGGEMIAASLGLAVLVAKVRTDVQKGGV